MKKNKNAPGMKTLLKNTLSKKFGPQVPNEDEGHCQ